MNIKRSIRFFFKKQKDTQGRVIMRIAYGGRKMDFQTGIVVDESNFDVRSQRIIGCKSANSLTSEYNEKLTRMMMNMMDVFHQYETQNVIPDSQSLRASFEITMQPKPQKPVSRTESSGILSVQNVAQNETDNVPVKKATKKRVKVKETKEKTFWECYDEFVRVNGKLNDWTDATREKFAAMRNHLWKFNKKLTFDDFDEDGFADYITFLSKKHKMKNSTINKQMGFLRWVLRWCYEKGYNKNHTFEYYKPKLKNAKKRVIFLTMEELKKLEEFEIPKEREVLEPIRDVFLFSCYTGLRFSDVYNLTWADIHDGKIEVVTEKTTDRILIELNKQSHAIISKYSGIHFPKNKVLPVVSNQKMNKHLHELCKLAGLDAPIKLTHYEGNKRVDEVRPKYELIGTHTGRRTFICMALAKGIPPSVVMKWTGHSDYKAMKPYIDVADEVKETYMKRFDD